jgi:hypothetical protein
MDPNATAAIMRDESLPLDERLEAADNLSDWLKAGGFPQSLYSKHDGSHRSFGGNTAAKFAARQEVDEYLRQFEAAIKADPTLDLMGARS